MSTIVTIVFKGGLGSVEAKLFRAGVEIDKDDTDKSGDLILKDAIPGDLISLKGVSPANGTDVTISVPTIPPTPDHRQAGAIIKSYDVS